jgi:hypothetical protein
MKRWLTTSELGDELAKRFPKVARMTRWNRAQHARRLVERAERLESVRCSKRDGRRMLVSVNALGFLLPTEQATVDRLEIEFGKLAQNQRALRRKVSEHSSKLGNHEERLGKTEQRVHLLHELAKLG